MATERLTLIADLQDRMTGPLQSVRKSVDDTTKAVQNHGERADKSLSKAEKAVQSLTGETERGATRSQRALAGLSGATSDFTADMSSATNKADRALSGLVGSTERAASRIDRALSSSVEGAGSRMVADLDSAGDRMVRKADGIGDRVGSQIKEGIEGKLNGISLPDAAATAAGGFGVGAGVTTSVQQQAAAHVAGVASDLDSGLVTGHADEAYYERNLGADYDQALSATTSVLATLEVEAGSPEAQALIDGTLTISHLYDVPPEVVALLTNSASKSFGVSYEEAQDVVAAGLRDTAPGSREGFIEAYDEYAPHAGSAGMPIDMFTEILSSSGDLGPMQVDKAGDTLKEWSLLVASDDQAVADAYEAAGLDQEDIARRMLEGDPTAFTDTMQGIATIEDPLERNRAAISIGGTPFEDMGIGQVDDLVTSFGTLEVAAGEADGTVTGMTEGMSDAPGAEWSNAMRDLSQSFRDVGREIAPLISGLAGIISFLSPLAGPAGLFMLVAGPVGFLYRVLTGKSYLDIAKSAIGWFAGDGGKNAAKTAGRLGGGIAGVGRALLGLPLVGAVAGIWLAVEAFKGLYEHSALVRGVIDLLADGWERATGNASNYFDMVDNGISGALGIENEGGHEEYKEMAAQDVRPGWLKDFTRRGEEWIGLGPQQKPHEGLFSLPNMEGRATGGWTGVGSVNVGERGREFVTSAWASNKLHTDNPGALEYMNATGTLPAAGNVSVVAPTPAPVHVTEGPIIIHAEGAAPGVEGAIRHAVEQALAARDKRATRGYMTPSLRGAN